MPERPPSAASEAPVRPLGSRRALIERAGVYLDPHRRSFLRLVELADSSFIHALRADEAIGQYLSGAAADEAAQRAWISRYMEREERGEEFYFVIVHEGAPLGTVRLYDFRRDPKTGAEEFCWGSWILRPDRPSGLAVYSCLISFGLGLEILNFDAAYLDVRLANTRANKFYQFIGAVDNGSDQLNRYYIYLSEALAALKQRSRAEIDSHSALWEPG